MDKESEAIIQACYDLLVAIVRDERGSSVDVINQLALRALTEKNRGLISLFKKAGRGDKMLGRARAVAAFSSADDPIHNEVIPALATADWNGYIRDFRNEFSKVLNAVKAIRDCRAATYGASKSVPILCRLFEVGDPSGPALPVVAQSHPDSLFPKDVVDAARALRAIPDWSYHISFLRRMTIDAGFSESPVVRPFDGFEQINHSLVLDSIEEVLDDVSFFAELLPRCAGRTVTISGGVRPIHFIEFLFHLEYGMSQVYDVKWDSYSFLKLQKRDAMPEISRSNPKRPTIPMRKVVGKAPGRPALSSHNWRMAGVFRPVGGRKPGNDLVRRSR